MKFISPSALSTYLRDPQEYYLKYLSKNRPPKYPQTQPMSVGSAFDACVKAAMYYDLHGSLTPEFEFETMFEKQVEPQNRDFARKAGLVCFNAYKHSGAYNKLRNVLLKAKNVLMEFKQTMKFDKESGREYAEVGGVNILGIPDLSYVIEGDFVVVHEFKVSGYCSPHNTSPTAGYVDVFDGWDFTAGKGSRGNGNPHKDCLVSFLQPSGFEHNLDHNIVSKKPEWGRQLCAYAWLSGVAVGGLCYMAVDELVCNDFGTRVRVARHRHELPADFQHGTFKQFQYLWELIHSDHFFRDLPIEESQARCQILDQQGLAFQSDGGTNDEWFRKAVAKR